MKLKDYKLALLRRLRDPDYAASYLASALEDNSTETFLLAVRDVIEARGERLTTLSEKSGVTRQTLYHAFSNQGNPRLTTLTEVMKSLGLQLSVKAAR